LKELLHREVITKPVLLISHYIFWVFSCLLSKKA